MKEYERLERTIRFFRAGLALVGILGAVLGSMLWPVAGAVLAGVNSYLLCDAVWGD